MNFVREKTPPPIHERFVCREPTPCPEVIEEVVIKKPAQRVIEQIIEKPRQPKPRVIRHEMYEGPEPPPIIQTKVKHVEPTPGKDYGQNYSPYGYCGQYDAYGGMYGYGNGGGGGGMCSCGCGSPMGYAHGGSGGGGGGGYGYGGPIDSHSRSSGNGMWVKRKSKFSEIVLQVCDLVYTVLD